MIFYSAWRTASLTVRLTAVTTVALALGGIPAAISAAAPPTAASSSDDMAPMPLDLDAAVTPKATSGRIGQRQSSGDAARQIGVEPLARLNGRIANRVQSRWRNRIDRYYDPQANATSPFIAADQQVRRKPR